MGLFHWLRHRNRRKYPPLDWQPTPSPEYIYMDSDGRRHRGDVPYLLPKDEQEMQRLDYQHFLLRQVLKGNCFAPVHELLRQGGHVLDVGCGTGRWGYEIAASYPRTQVIGLDIEEAARTPSTPLNYQFQRGNLLTGLPFVAHSFEYVHQRLLVGGIPLARWPVVIQELRRVTVPGGWIELVEMGTAFHQCGPATRQVLAWWADISAFRGIDASQMVQIGGWLQQAGLLHIQSETKVLPVGNWGGRVGNLLAHDMLAGCLTIRPLAQSLLGVSPQTFDAVLADLELEWNTSQTTYEVYFACGQV